MYWRPLAQRRRVVGIDQERDQKPYITAVDADADESIEAAVTDDDEDAGQRDGDAAGLARGKAIAKQHEAPQSDKQRPDRLQQETVDRSRVLQAVIGHRVEGREAGQREHGHQSGVRADRRPIAQQVWRGERQHNQKGTAPANESERHRRNVSSDETTEHGIAGPEQRGE